MLNDIWPQIWLIKTHPLLLNMSIHLNSSPPVLPLYTVHTVLSPLYNPFLSFVLSLSLFYFHSFILFLLFQVTDKSLMSLIKQKCDLALPYAGAFLKKNDKYIIL